MPALDLVRLTPLMQSAAGRSDIAIGLIDGPVATSHPDLAAATLREVPSRAAAVCRNAGSAACVHGTFVAGILCARRGSAAPAICPGCALLVRSIFGESAAAGETSPSATPEDLAAAILECIAAGARVINLSVGLAQPSIGGQRALTEALDEATRRGVLVVAAAGNQGTLGSSAITRHPWVIPVVACDDRGRPLQVTNFGSSSGLRGLRAPGAGVTSLSAAGGSVTLAGTSVATPFVTGALALLWSAFPSATAAEIKLAATGAPSRRRSVVPPLLDAWTAYQTLAGSHSERRTFHGNR